MCCHVFVSRSQQTADFPHRSVNPLETQSHFSTVKVIVFVRICITVRIVHCCLQYTAFNINADKYYYSLSRYQLTSGLYWSNSPTDGLLMLQASSSPCALGQVYTSVLHIIFSDLDISTWIVYVRFAVCSSEVLVVISL